MKTGRDYREERERLGLTQGQLGKLLGCGANTVHLRERREDVKEECFLALEGLEARRDRRRELLVNEGENPLMIV